MNKQAAVAIALIHSLMPAAGGAGESPTGSDTGFQVIAQGHRSSIESRREVVVRDAGAFQTLWAEHVAGLTPPPPIPEVDFSRQLVVAVFAGARPTGGYSLQPSAPLPGQGINRIRFFLKQPGPDCMAAQVMTQPYAMVRLPRNKAKIRIEVTEAAGGC